MHRLCFELYCVVLSLFVCVQITILELSRALVIRINEVKYPLCNTISIAELEMQSCHNDVRAMTPCFYVSNEGATLGLSRATCKKSVASVIVEIVRAKERSPKRPETEKMVPGRARMRVSGKRRI